MAGIFAALLAGGLAAQSGSQGAGNQSPGNQSLGNRGFRNTGPASEQNGQTIQGGLGQAGTGTMGFRLGYYNNGDSGDGNPFLDEELTVIEPVIYLDYNITDKTNVWTKFAYDYVSSASIERLSKFPDQGGASRDNYFGLDVGVNVELDEDSRMGGFIHASAEYDYRSFGFGGSYGYDLADDNATISHNASVYLDSLDVIRFNGTEEGSEDRTAVNLGTTWYQVLDTRMFSELGFNFTWQDGFLETPYNAVVLEDPTDPPNPNLVNFARGTEFSEELPEDRMRGTLFGRLRRLVDDNWAVEMSGRVYADDWGVTSFTVQPSVFTWLVRDRLALQMRYRFYSQTESDDYRANFTGALPQFRTQDADLADFTSNTLGFSLEYYLQGGSRWDLQFDYQARSDGLDNIFGSIGWTSTF